MEQNDIINRLEVKQRNSAGMLGEPQTQVVSFDFTPDKKTMITVDQLNDLSTQIKIQQLKIWS
jgi:hypothetical protein